MTFLTILREHKRFWLPLVIILLLNGIIYIGYRYVFFGKIREEWNKKVQLEERLKIVEAENRTLKDSTVRLQETIANRDSLYDKLSDKETRLTILLAHLDDLTIKAQLTPHSWSYSESEVALELPIVQFAISFPVEGTYANVRKLLHFLELSEQFIIVDQIALSGAGEFQKDVNLSISMKTYFNVDKPPIIKKPVKKGRKKRT